MKTDAEIKSNFLVAFIAVVIGFAAFGEKLNTRHVNIFGFSPSLYDLFFVFLIIIALSPYFTALAHFAGMIPNSKLRIGKHLNYIANVFGAAGLLIPLALTISAAMTYFIGFIPNINIDYKYFVYIASLVTLVSVLFAAKSSNDAKSERIESLYTSKLEESISREVKLIEKNRVSKNTEIFLTTYSLLCEAITDYLRFEGYGVGRTNLVSLVKNLERLGVVDSSVLDKAIFAMKQRNIYMHTGSWPDNDSSEKAAKSIEYIAKALKKAINKKSKAWT